MCSCLFIFPQFVKSKRKHMRKSIRGMLGVIAPPIQYFAIWQKQLNNIGDDWINYSHCLTKKYKLKHNNSTSRYDCSLSIWQRFTISTLGIHSNRIIFYPHADESNCPCPRDDSSFVRGHLRLVPTPGSLPWPPHPWLTLQQPPGRESLTCRAKWLWDVDRGKMIENPSWNSTFQYTYRGGLIHYGQSFHEKRE